ncbi:MAG: hypothetical protein QW047_08895 [Sulfolobales archaeon]
MDVEDETGDLNAYVTDDKIKLERYAKFREFKEFKKFIDELSKDYIIKPVAGDVEEKNNEPQVKFLIVVLFKKPVASDTQYATPLN